MMMVLCTTNNEILVKQLTRPADVTVVDQNYFNIPVVIAERLSCIIVDSIILN